MTEESIGKNRSEIDRMVAQLKRSERTFANLVKAVPAEIKALVGAVEFAEQSLRSIREALKEQMLQSGIWHLETDRYSISLCDDGDEHHINVEEFAEEGSDEQ